jgi:hypothetical protein
VQTVQPLLFCCCPASCAVLTGLEDVLLSWRVLMHQAGRVVLAVPAWQRFPYT